MCQVHTCLCLGIPFTVKSLTIELIFNDEQPKTMQLTNNKLEKQCQNKCFWLVVYSMISFQKLLSSSLS